MKDKPSLRERILDALECCFDRHGIHKTTLADVAAEAGISRMTVYRQFKDRQALFAAAALRNIGRQWETISAQLTGHSDLDDWLLEAMVLFHRIYTDDATVKLYTRIGGHDEGLRVALTPEGLEAVSTHFLPAFHRARESARLAPGITVEGIAQWIHRTNHSLIAFPSSHLRDENRLRYWLGSQICGGLVQNATATATASN